MIIIQESNADVRISIIVNPLADTNNNTIDINQIVLAALHTLPVEKIMRFIRNIIKEDMATVILNEKKVDIEVIILLKNSQNFNFIKIII